MKLPLKGVFRDHAGEVVPYMIRRCQDVPGEPYVCDIDPHCVGEWNAAGRGRSHAEAVSRAREWWRRFDSVDEFAPGEVPA